MYRPKHFAEDREDVLINYIRAHRLGLVVTHDMQANLVPMNVHFKDGKHILRCHLARANSQLNSLKQNGKILIVFSGQHSYISPDLYPTKKIDGKAVPTWNYSMVQIRGVAKVFDDSDWVLKQVTDMTNELEGNKEQPWKVTDAPEDYIKARLKSIVGVEVTIESIEGKFKVSQNQPDENREAVKEHFEKEKNIEMAEYVGNRGPR